MLHISCIIPAPCVDRMKHSEVRKFGDPVSSLMEQIFALSLEQLKHPEFALSSLELSETLKRLIMMEVSCGANEKQTPDAFNTVLQ